MRCPICKSDLVVVGQAYLETLDEHVTCTRVCLKDKYVCSDPACSSHSVGSCWNDMGDYYADVFNVKHLPFVDGLRAAFGSIARKLEVEIDKHDEDRYFKINFWPLKGWQLVLRRVYQANEDGEILRRRTRREWIKPDHTVYVSGWRMLRFSIAQLWRASRWSAEKFREELRDDVRHARWPRAEWWRKVMGFLSGIILRVRYGEKEVAERF